MTELAQELVNRFGAKHVLDLKVSLDEIPLLLITVDLNSPVKILMTNGLSGFKMLVPEKWKGREYNELYFCLPSYWDLEEADNPQMNWVKDWIQKLAKHVVAKNTWFGPGHTIPCGNPFTALSSTMKCNHFFLSDPLLLENHLEPSLSNGKLVYFLAIIPIFEDEIDYKQGKGTFKLLKKLKGKGVTEKLDDFRKTSLKSKWRFVKS
jgi:hypothetical protein